MSEKPLRGVHDPWRLYSPDREPDPEASDTPTGAPGSMHPLDADLLPHQEYVFRHPQASGDLLIYGSDTAEGAALLLLSVLQALPELHSHLTEAGCVWGPTASVHPRGFVIRTKEHIFCIPDARSTADGLGRLVTTLRGCPSTLRKRIEKAGIIPLLK